MREGGQAAAEQVSRHSEIILRGLIKATFFFLITTTIGPIFSELCFLADGLVVGEVLSRQGGLPAVLGISAIELALHTCVKVIQ